MRKLVLTAVPLVLITAGVLYWYFNFAPDADNQLKTLTTVEKTGDECSFISEKAAMHLPEALPFQKLEKAARKARVMSQCMQDRGYAENPLWIKNTKFTAQKNAESQHISFDEAYEAIRREAIYKFKAEPIENTYWVIVNKP